jgi:hypothetical protein
MTKQEINLMLINGLKAKGHLIGNINPEILNDVATIIHKQLALTGVGYRAMDMQEILNEAQRRRAKHSVQYADYSLDTWTVASDLLEHRKTNLLADASVRKVRIEYEM